MAQSAWLQRGTIRENIVWGEIFDENRYKKVLFACALHKDIEVLDESRAGIGEGGRTLSGGQRARIALARAVYQKKQSKLSSPLIQWVSNPDIISLAHDLKLFLDFHCSLHNRRCTCLAGCPCDQTRCEILHFGLATKHNMPDCNRKSNSLLLRQSNSSCGEWSCSPERYR